jgi:hypothetical protein
MSIRKAGLERGFVFTGIILFLLGMPMVGTLHFGGASLFAGEKAAPSDPLISVDAQNEPLGEVLEALTRETSYQFTIEEQWQDHPITTVFRNLPLGDGLKRILANLNHVIVYESEKKIKIAIFGEAEAGGGTRFSRSYERPAMPTPQPDRFPERSVEQPPSTEEERPPGTDRDDTPDEREPLEKDQ